MLMVSINFWNFVSCETKKKLIQMLENFSGGEEEYKKTENSPLSIFLKETFMDIFQMKLLLAQGRLRCNDFI